MLILTDKSFVLKICEESPFSILSSEHDKVENRHADNDEFTLFAAPVRKVTHRYVRAYDSGVHCRLRLSGEV